MCESQRDCVVDGPGFFARAATRCTTTVQAQASYVAVPRTPPAPPGPPVRLDRIASDFTVRYKARARQVALSACDFLADGRAPFHPVKPTESYAIQKDEAAVAVAEFTAEGGRLDRWLAHFATLVDNKPRYLFGDTITYADCALFHVLDAAMSQFPDAWDEPSREKLRATLEPYMKLITMHVTLGAYLKADDRAPWAGDSMM